VNPSIRSSNIPRGPRRSIGAATRHCGLGSSIARWSERRGPIRIAARSLSLIGPLGGSRRPRICALRAGRGSRSQIRREPVPRFGQYDLSAIGHEDVQGLVNDLVATGAAPATVRKVFHTLSAVMRSAVEADRISRSPCANVRLPEAQRRQMRVLTAEEFHRLAEEVPARDRALVLVRRVPRTPVVRTRRAARQRRVLVGTPADGPEHRRRAERRPP
jgi:hypothetical protein